MCSVVYEKNETRKIFIYEILWSYSYFNNLILFLWLCFNNIEQHSWGCTVYYTLRHNERMLELSTEDAVVAVVDGWLAVGIAEEENGVEIDEKKYL